MHQYEIVWLDTNSLDPMSSFSVKLGNVQLFAKVDECIEYIQSHSHQPLFLIVSGSLGKEIVPRVYDLEQVQQIYLFCGSISAYVQWGLEYCDKMLMFDHEDDLLERLWNDLHKRLREQATMCMKKAEEFRKRALQYKQPCG